MTVKKFTIEVMQQITVELDDELLNEEFNEAFSDVFFDVDSLEDHAGHLAHLEACGMISLVTEGYGNLEKMNIKTSGYRDTEVEIMSTEIVEPSADT